MDLKAELSHFTGTSQYYRHKLTGLYYTDGVKFLAERAEAYWLIDAVFSYQGEPAIAREPFQVWTLEKDDLGAGATLTCQPDIPGPVLARQKIDFTDFPVHKIHLYLAGKVLYLPSEH